MSDSQLYWGWMISERMPWQQRCMYIICSENIRMLRCLCPAPRLRPIINNDKINPKDVHETQLCQILCAYRIFLPYAGITVSSREVARFRDHIIRFAATKISAGVSTGIGDHEEKYTGKENEAESGDEQFEIADNRSLQEIYDAIKDQGLQPVLNEYIYV